MASWRWLIPVAALAAARGRDDLHLAAEDDGDYVRLHTDAPALFFKHRMDPTDPRDRERFGKSKRILLSEEDCAMGPEATLALIDRLLEKFADYTYQRT